jgi:segregation and condensation protein B
MPPSQLHSAIEALLFASDQPLTLPLLAEALEASPEEVADGLRELGEQYTARGAGVQLRQIAGGWLFMTAPEQNEWLTRMLRGKRKARLSRAALETLAIIAYKQPVTKSEAEAIRGVDCSGTLATLLERNLVTIKGRSTVVGRPLLYGTTPEFLDYFGLHELAELPRPEELRALIAAREPEQMEMLELEPATGLPLALAPGEDAPLELGERAVRAPEWVEASPEGLEPETAEVAPEDEDAFTLAEADAVLAESGLPARAALADDFDLEAEAVGSDLPVARADADDDALAVAGEDEDDDEEYEDDDDDEDDWDDDLDEDDDDDEDEDEDEDADDSEVTPSGLTLREGDR